MRMSVSVSDCFGIDHPSSWSASSLPGPQHIVSGCGRQALAASLRRQEETKTRLVYTAHAELTHGFLSLATLNGGARKVKAETPPDLSLKVTEATPSRAWPAPTATGQPAGEGWEGAEKHVIVPTLRRGNGTPDAPASRFVQHRGPLPILPDWPPYLHVPAVPFSANLVTLERQRRRSHAGAWERSLYPLTTRNAGPAGRTVRKMTGLRGRKTALWR